MSSNLNRRNFLILGLGATSTALAGCMGNGQTENGQQQDTQDNQNQTNTQNQENGQNVRFGDVVRFEDSFAVESSFEDEQGNQVSTTGRFHQGNFYYRVDMDQQTMELYNVNGERYLVYGGGESCMRDPSQQIDPSSGGLDPDTYQSDISEYSEITSTGRTTIDGEEMYIFEFQPQQNNQTTYYVSVDTGYIRRMENQNTIINFHSWNNVDPINQPDMECQQMPQSQGMPSGQNSYY